MELNWNLFILFCVFSGILYRCDAADDNQALVVSYFPYVNVSGHLQIFQGDVEQLNNKSPFTLHRFSNFVVLITSMQLDPANNALYMYDAATNTIYRINNFNIHLNNTDISIDVVYHGISRATVTIAYDYLTHNIYFTDPLQQHIVMINAHNNVDTGRTLVLDHGLDYPIAVGIDPVEGLLFWGNWRSSGGMEIERGKLLAGDAPIDDRKTIAAGLGKVDAFFVDVAQKLLYWSDSGRGTIEVCDYNGGNRSVIRRFTGRDIRSIAVINNILCGADSDSYWVFCMDITDKTLKLNKLHPTQSPPYAVGIYDQQLQVPGPNPCKDRGCAEMCLNIDGKAQCACRDGALLQNNGVTCVANTELFERGVLFTNGTDICMAELQTATTTPAAKIKCITAPVMNATLIASDANNYRLFYYDEFNMKIVNYEMTSWRNVRQSTFVVKKIDGMTYDWVSSTLYLTYANVGEIRAVKTYAPESGVDIIYRNIIAPTEIVCDPHTLTLYWISNGNTIYRGNMDGRPDTIKAIVASDKLTNPSGLFFDYFNLKLYFINDKVLTLVNPDGTQLQFSITVTTGKQVVISNDYALWTDQRTYIKSSLHSLRTKPTVIDTTIHGSITGFSLFDKNIQKQYPDPCKKNNGGCSQICRPKDEKDAECFCYRGFEFTDINKTICGSVPLTRDFFLVTDLDHDIIYQISKDGSILKALNIPTVSVPAMVRYDKNQDYIYWADVGSKSINQIRLDTFVPKTVVQLDSGYPDRLAIDYSGGNIYFTAANHLFFGSFIGVFNPTNMKTKNKNDFKYLRIRMAYIGGIVVHPQDGYIYFNEHAIGGPYIGRMDMDGQNLVVLVTSDLQSPLGMAIDFKRNKLFWTDAWGNDRIEYSDFDGKNRAVLHSDKLGHQIDLVIDNGFVYYVGYGKQKIVKVLISSGVEQQLMDDVPEFGHIDSVELFPTDNTQPIHNMCQFNNGGCLQYCLPRPQNKARCDCISGQKLLADNRTCNTSDLVCPRTFKNGAVTAACKPNVYSTCLAVCDLGYTLNPKINPKLTCLKSEFWDKNVDELCIKTTCPTSALANGKFSTDCVPEAGNTCGFECDKNNGYVKKDDVTLIGCQSSGKWSEDVTTVCKKVIFCPVLNVTLDPKCSRRQGLACAYKCNNMHNAAHSYVMCLNSGRWSVSEDDLCKETQSCSNIISNGKLVDGCKLTVGSECDYTCQSGYSATKTKAFCKEKTLWDEDLCVKGGKPKVGPQVDNTNAGAYVGIGIAVTLVIVIVILGAIFFVFRRKIFTKANKPQGTFRASPNVYFNAGEIPNSTYANGDMPNTSPVTLDQVKISTEKDAPDLQNSTNEGTYETIKAEQGSVNRSIDGGIENPYYSAMKGSEEVPYKVEMEHDDPPQKGNTYQRFQ